MGARTCLPNLQSVGLCDPEFYIPLQPLVQLFKAAPKLSEMHALSGQAHVPLTVDCYPKHVTNTSNSADLSYLLATMAKHEAIKVVNIRLDCSQPDVPPLLQPFLAALPLMVGVTQCELVGLIDGQLSTALSLFPDVQTVGLVSMNDMSDVELQDLVVCRSLTAIVLTACNKVTPMGLLSLCQRLPNLLSVHHKECSCLTETSLEGCVQLLAKHGLLVKVVGINDLQVE